MLKFKNKEIKISISIVIALFIILISQIGVNAEGLTVVDAQKQKDNILNNPEVVFENGIKLYSTKQSNHIIKLNETLGKDGKNLDEHAIDVVGPRDSVDKTTNFSMGENEINYSEKEMKEIIDFLSSVDNKNGNFNVFLLDKPLDGADGFYRRYDKSIVLAKRWGKIQTLYHEFGHHIYYNNLAKNKNFKKEYESLFINEKINYTIIEGVDKNRIWENQIEESFAEDVRVYFNIQNGLDMFKAFSFKKDAYPTGLRNMRFIERAINNQY